MYTVTNNTVVFTPGPNQVCTIHPTGDQVSVADFHPSALNGPERVKLFNAMIAYAKGVAMEGSIPEAVKRFPDGVTALRRISILQAQIADHLAAHRTADPVVEPEPVIADKPTKPAVVKAPKAKKTAEPAEIVEVKGPKALGALITCVASKKDGSTYVVGQRSFTDDMTISNIAEKAGHVDREPRWHLYRDGMTVAEFLADAKAWLRTQPEFAGRPDGGPNGLNWKVRDWLAADAKRSNRITIG